MPFQTKMNVSLAPGIAGNFCSTNPRHSALSVQGGFMAGPQGLTIGCFAWADTATGTILSNSGTGMPTCFVHRANQALLTVYLSEYGMTIPAGQGVGEMFDGGDFWCVNSGSGATTIGLKAFASLTNGTVSFAAAGSTVTGSVETNFSCNTTNAAGELVKITSHKLV